MRGSDILLGGRVSGADLEGRIAAAQAFPLGSRENPVRVSMPEGQRAYLARLRCTDGKAPTFERTGNLGPGVYGSIVDNYAVVCAGNPPTEFNIVMDMYHGRHIENAAPPGFTITP